MDLRCINAGCGGYFYKSHLPRLGPSRQMSHSKEQSAKELPSLSSKTDGEIQRLLPSVKDDDRDTCTLNLTCGATDSTGSLPQEGAGSVDVTSPDSQVKVNCIYSC